MQGNRGSSQDVGRALAPVKIAPRNPHLSRETTSLEGAFRRTQASMGTWSPIAPVSSQPLYSWTSTSRDRASDRRRKPRLLVRSCLRIPRTTRGLICLKSTVTSFSIPNMPRTPTSPTAVTQSLRGFTPSAAAAAVNVTPAHATRACRSMFPEQGSSPVPPIAG